MFYERIPYARLMVLADLSPDLLADVDALHRLADYAARSDWGGRVHREIANALVPDPRRLDRLCRADLVHDAPGAKWCGCGVWTDVACLSLHAPLLAAAALAC